MAIKSTSRPGPPRARRAPPRRPRRRARRAAIRPCGPAARSRAGRSSSARRTLRAAPGPQPRRRRRRRRPRRSLSGSSSACRSRGRVGLVAVEHPLEREPNGPRVQRRELPNGGEALAEPARVGPAVAVEEPQRRGQVQRPHAAVADRRGQRLLRCRPGQPVLRGERVGQQERPHRPHRAAGRGQRHEPHARACHRVGRRLAGVRGDRGDRVQRLGARPRTEQDLCAAGPPMCYPQCPSSPATSAGTHSHGCSSGGVRAGGSASMSKR